MTPGATWEPFRQPPPDPFSPEEIGPRVPRGLAFVAMGALVLLAALGIEASARAGDARSALPVSLGALMAIWALGFLLARELYGPESALATLVLLFTWAALSDAAGRFSRELPPTALALLSVWIQATHLHRRERRSPRTFPRAPLYAGVVAGAAFALHPAFALAPLLALPAFFGRVPRERAWRDTRAWAISFVAPAAIALARGGAPLRALQGAGAVAHPAPLANLRALAGMAGSWSPVAIAAAVACAIGVAALVVLLWRRAESWRGVLSVFGGFGRALVPLWAGGWVLLVVVLAPPASFAADPARLSSPAVVFALVVLGALAAHALAYRAWRWAIAALVVPLLLAAFLAARLSLTPGGPV